MRFKSFLLETNLPNKPFVDTVTEVEFVEWIKKHASKYVSTSLGKDSAIFRGVASDVPFSLGDTSKFKRIAAHTENYVNCFLEKSPRWKKYPSRMQAYICTNSRYT